MIATQLALLVVPNSFFPILTETLDILDFISFNCDFEQGSFWWKSLRVVNLLPDPEPRHVALQIGFGFDSDDSDDFCAGGSLHALAI